MSQRLSSSFRGLQNGFKTSEIEMKNFWSKTGFFNQFHDNALFYTLENVEKPGFVTFSKGIETKHWREID